MDEAHEGVQQQDETRVAQAAGIVSLGNFASRVLGVLRGMAVSYLFGAGGDVSALTAALRIPIMIYDLLVGGVLSSAFVPVFSDYAPPERREELWHVLGVLLTIVLLTLSLFVLIGELLAPQLIWLQAGGLSPQYQELAVGLLRLVLPVVVFLSVASVISGALYALKRFAFPAFLGAVSNAAMIVLALLLGNVWGVSSMALGMVVGSVLQVVLQLLGMRDARLRLVFDLRHPALRRIGRLCLPIFAGLAVDKVAEVLSYRLASGLGDSAMAWMEYAAQVIQFPLGLVAAAISIAILPTLSRQVGAEGIASFRATLVQGLRLVLVLVIPATVGLYILARPAVALIFERGGFVPTDTAAVAEVLRYSLLGLLAAAVDQPLIFAFYARKDTLTPALVGVGTTILYVLVAALALQLGVLTLPLLVLLNAFKLASHALAMFFLAWRRLGGLGRHGLGGLALKAALASLVMALVVWGVARLLEGVALPAGGGSLLIVGGAGGVGVAVYGLAAWAMRVQELRLLRATVHNGLGRLTGSRR